MGILTPLGTILLASTAILVAACDKSDKCKDQYCASASSKPTGALQMPVLLSPVTGWDSIAVVVRSGSTIESGTVVESWIVKPGVSHPTTLTLSAGEYSARATYMRAGDTLEAIDGGSVDWVENTDECDCFVDWKPQSGKLDLR